MKLQARGAVLPTSKALPTNGAPKKQEQPDEKAARLPGKEDPTAETTDEGWFYKFGFDLQQKAIR